ncbi:hypothetical protein KDL44_09740 [bacterium]|nr:hypothetical protein [bacterium]
MKPHIYTFLTAILLVLSLCGSCKRPDEGEKNKPGAAGGTGDKAVAVEPAPQQQAVPDAEQFNVDEKQKDARGADSQLPASWPAGLPLPEGAEISQAASREGTDMVEFSIGGAMSDVVSRLAADADAAGFTLREAEQDKYSQRRSYSRENKLYSMVVTDVEGRNFGSLSISELFPSQSFSGSVHYTGEFSLPADWPSDILPVYEGSVLRELYVPLPGQAGRLMLSAQNSATEADVISWLEQELSARGWTAGEKASRNGFSIRKFTGNGYSLSVAARGIDGLTDIQYEASPI